MTKPKQKTIPEPPNNDAPPEELAAYYEQYSPQDLLEAGYMQVLSKDDPRVAQQKAIAGELRAKRKRAQLNIVFSEDELTSLMAYADAIHIPPSTIAKSWILRALKIEKERFSETRL